MSEDPPIDPTGHPLPDASDPMSAPAERARVDAAPASKRLDALPILYLVGFVILAVAVIYVWRHPATPRGVAQQAATVQTLQQEVAARKQETDALAERLAKLEAKPAAASLGPVDAKIAQLAAQESQSAKAMDGRLAALEKAQAGERAQEGQLQPLEARVGKLEAVKPTDLAPVEKRVQALEQRPPVDLGPLSTQVAALGKTQASDQAALSGTVDAAEKHVAAIDAAQQKIEAAQQATEAAQKRLGASLQAIDDRSRQAGRLQAASAALGAGQKLGTIPGAPPALAKFADVPPPTEAGLKASFDTAARAAEHASQPAIMDDKPFLDRLWTRAQQSVTVRQGDRVLLGDPIAGVIQHARQQLDAGDLEASIKALGGLAGPAKAAMADWVAQAQSLVDARAAIGSMAAHS